MMAASNKRTYSTSSNSSVVSSSYFVTLGVGEYLSRATLETDRSDLLICKFSQFFNIQLGPLWHS